jgi:heme exporter protein D
MNLELFILGGYGHFVWPAFMFTLVSCFVFYLKTNKTFQKEEKIFLREFKQIQEIKIKKVKKQEALSDALIS